jgi:hypothetical protein
MDFKKQLCLIENNQDIKNYFEKKDLQSFIEKYIQVDQLINSNDIKPNLILNHLNQIQNNISLLNTQPTLILQQLTQIQNNISLLNSGLKQQLYDCVSQINNKEIRECINQIKQSKDDNLKQILDNFQDKFIINNNLTLSEFDTKCFNIIQNLQSSFNSNLDSHNISHKINEINKTMSLLHNTFTHNSSKKGIITENILFNNLIKAFPSSEVVNTSNISNSGDIMIKHDDHPTILIDSKNYNANVPKTEVEKFYRDCLMNNCSGILCNSNNGISNKDNFHVDIHESKILIYISNHEFNISLFQLAVKIIYNIHKIIQNNKTDNVELDKKLFERIKQEFNHFLYTFHSQVSTIKQSVHILENLTMNQLDNLFKNNFHELKPYHCSICGSGYSSTKTLNKHMKTKHQDLSKISKHIHLTPENIFD